MKTRTRKNRHTWIIAGIIVLAFFAAWFVSRFFCQVMLIQGESMEPSYHHLQPVLVNKHNREFAVGDVAAFSCEGLSVVLVKRIAAGPGDTALIRDGTLYRNGEVSECFETGVFSDAGILETEITLGDGEYVMLGDNVAESIDSRNEAVGIVKERDIIGVLCD
ncbi:MAG: signal peptidase I [Lachnospiraceae bacterium]|nr:signal peptidase I [Lachnospiraceae bacterium]